MSAFTLKLIAIVAMTFDHIAYTFFPHEALLRLVGRLTIVIMTYFVSVGYKKTHDRKRYLTRLFIFALISEIPFYLLFCPHTKIIFFEAGSNVIFSLFFGAFALYLADVLEKKRREFKYFRGLLYIAAIIISVLLDSDWSYTAPLLIFAFYHAGEDKYKRIVYPIIVYIVCFAYELHSLGNPFAYIQLAGVAAVPLLLMYNGKRGPNLKYLFYIYYPLHLLIIYLIKTCFFAA